MQKIRNIQKFPSRIPITLNWYQSAIAHLLLFKYLKQKHNNCVYFLISQQGIQLKATTQIIRDNVKQQIDKFFTAKIQQLQISQSSLFYQTILKDIQQQTQRLKDTRDCPYINLVYSEKIKNSCLAMKKFGYSKPYQNWETYQRQRKGFCFLIVRPQHRWKEIAANVMAIVKKRQISQNQNNKQTIWKIQISYEKFIWMYLKPQFQTLKKSIQVIQTKNQPTLTLLIQKQLIQYAQIQKQLSLLKHKYTSLKPKLKTQPKRSIQILSSFQIQKITQLIFHQFGLPKFVRQMRRNCTEYIVIGSQIQLVIIDDNNQIENNVVGNREDLLRIYWKDVEHVLKIGKIYNIVKWQNSSCVTVRYDLPLKQNIQKTLKLRMPCLPKYYAYFYKDTYIYLLRKYQPIKFKQFLELHKDNIFLQIQLIISLIQITQQLHLRKINIGSKFMDLIFIDQNRIIIEPGENGSNVEDNSKLTLMLREWVKEMKCCEIKQELEKVNQPKDMLEVLNKYVDEEN